MITIDLWKVAISSSASLAGGIFRLLFPHEDYFSGGLYTFDIGQNDLTSGYFSGMTTEEVKATIPNILSQFTIAIEVSSSSEMTGKKISALL